MYAISRATPEGETTYWIGGEDFSGDPEKAARFVKEVDAEATILVLMRALPDATELTISTLPDLAAA
jgi:hypothetical protein